MNNNTTVRVHGWAILYRWAHDGRSGECVLGPLVLSRREVREGITRRRAYLTEGETMRPVKMHGTAIIRPPLSRTSTRSDHD